MADTNSGAQRRNPARGQAAGHQTAHPHGYCRHQVAASSEDGSPFTGALAAWARSRWGWHRCARKALKRHRLSLAHRFSHSSTALTACWSATPGGGPRPTQAGNLPRALRPAGRAGQRRGHATSCALWSPNNCHWPNATFCWHMVRSRAAHQRQPGQRFDIAPVKGCCAS